MKFIDNYERKQAKTGFCDKNATCRKCEKSYRDAVNQTWRCRITGYPISPDRRPDEQNPNLMEEV